ncbi:hypothetical protein D0T12_28865 [Actinomadura spongiicola]|uniref:Uncharacterized protein n=1 Tax=Actinomadura spongiicola TaxID=2303421 RepID=A0A372GA29_9ACTN|nr:hypothetical protein [Actinomadura spongiicola]RFS82248.1 hypothetical protein D0T12_28865 [Actinomadura spongiicola]
MAYSVSRLNRTTTAHWWLSLEKSEGRERIYRALRDLLDAGAPAYTAKPTRPALNRQLGITSSSTFYHAINNSRFKEALGHSDFRALLDRSDAMATLVAEAKIWSYADHRQGWLNGLSRLPGGSVRCAVLSLVHVLSRWAVAEPGLATVYGFAAPHSAVQDLCTVLPCEITETRAGDLLAKVVTEARGPFGVSSGAVVDAVYDDLTEILHAPAAITGMVEGIRGRLRDLQAPLGSLSDAELDAALPTWVPREALRLLTEGA